MKTLLIIEDERITRESFRRFFEREGFGVRVARNGKDGVAQFAAEKVDLILLDVDMPGWNGFFTCQELRKLDRTVPIVFLTGLTADVDQLRGFEQGGDDYIFKGVEPQILLARVNALLARRATWSQESPPPIWALGQVKVNRETGDVLRGEEVLAKLTENEVAILQVLFAHRGRLVTAQALMESVHGGPYRIEPSALRAYFSRLRQKLGPAGDLIQTERNRGYRLI